MEIMGVKSEGGNKNFFQTWEVPERVCLCRRNARELLAGCRETSVCALGVVLGVSLGFFSLRIPSEVVQKSAVSHVSCFNYSVCVSFISLPLTSEQFWHVPEASPLLFCSQSDHPPDTERSGRYCRKYLWRIHQVPADLLSVAARIRAGLTSPLPSFHSSVRYNLRPGAML